MKKCESISIATHDIPCGGVRSGIKRNVDPNRESRQNLTPDLKTKRAKIGNRNYWNIAIISVPTTSKSIKFTSVGFVKYNDDVKINFLKQPKSMPADDKYNFPKTNNCLFVHKNDIIQILDNPFI